jgi:DnaK suppressor protein
MTQSEIENFRTELKFSQAELLLKQNGDRDSIAVETSADELDRTRHSQDREMAIGAIGRHSRLLKSVRAALGRLDLGSFGICVHCEEKISMKRLAAMPWADSCIVCQRAAETKGNPSWNISGTLLGNSEA